MHTTDTHTPTDTDTPTHSANDTPDSTHFGFQSMTPSEKTEAVGKVFHSVAKRYDLMNNLMSFGLHHVWKQIAIARLNLKPAQHVLDLAGGTGFLTKSILKRIRPRFFIQHKGHEGRVTLVDINASMLAEGKKRLINAGIASSVQYLQGNAESLPVANDTFDRAIIGFGLRNVTFKEKALSELFRTVKPGGQIVILEFSHPTSPVVSKLYDLYSFNVLPWLGKVVQNDAESYQYLAESIRMHPCQHTLKEMMMSAGFQHCDFQNIHGGIVAIHTGFKY